MRNCVAHDGQRAPIQLVDEKGCVVREKIMSPFKKIKNFDTTANVLSYAYFQAGQLLFCGSGLQSILTSHTLSNFTLFLVCSRLQIVECWRRGDSLCGCISINGHCFVQAFKFPDSMNVHFQCVVQVILTSHWSHDQHTGLCLVSLP